ncbi:hypothetical protein [Legionella tunisiensis]|uniref:hypothetical protein n=1 Tax=Legionella tunisiensis TaxID=1034944 RepID=UPI00031068A4|nr:hypothetical protein [Legionella tunisiensis]
MAYTKAEKIKQTVPEQTKYHLFAFVKDTVDGPGHVSISAVKETTVKKKINHTSFFPGPLGSFINGITLGSVPVKGKLAPNHQEDLEEAEHVLVKPIDKEQYKSAVQAQKSFSRDVAEGMRFYSVFGTLNPLATFVTSFFTAHGNAHATIEKHKKIMVFTQLKITVEFMFMIMIVTAHQ